MTRALPKTIAAIEPLLAAASEPIYLVDSQRRLCFVNDACARWLDVEAARLLGTECRYHSQPTADPLTDAAAALCPPPAALAGRRTTGYLVPPTDQAAAPRRRAEFIPLTQSGDSRTSVLVIVAPRDEPPADAEPPEDVAAADDLHGLLRRYREKMRTLCHVDRLLGTSPAMRRVREQVSLAAACEASVLILGPVGSGRQHVARAIHYGRHGVDSKARIVPLACSLVAGELLESTVAALVRSHENAPIAMRPTLLLGDVDQLPLESQRPLADLLTQQARLRLVATSRRPLAELASTGAFRGDLAAALSTLVIELPPLAGRPGDLPLLAQALLEEENIRGAKQLAGFEPQVLDRLAAYWWPGDVDELRDTIRHAYEAAQGHVVCYDDLPLRIRSALAPPSPPTSEAIDLDEMLKEIERELVVRALARAEGNKAKAARLLGLTRPRLYRRMVQLGLDDAERGDDASADESP